MNKIRDKVWRATTFGLFLACLVAPVQANEDNLSKSLLLSIAKSDDQAAKVNPSGNTFSGNVSWYGPGFQGRKTASGEVFDMNKLTSAHRKLPFGTRILVEDPRTGDTVIVKVNDRGPYVRTRVMDLTREGAHKLGTLGRGVAYVDCLILGPI